MPAAPATEPSARARELVRGAYDLHVHVEPDLAQRRIDDLSLARRFAELGLAGFVLKSHYVPTAERAAVVRAAVPGVDALGAIALNAGVGGLNAQAVEIAARGGARIVWLPTVDSENEASEDGPKPAKQPVWRKIQDEFAAAGVASEPVRADRRSGLARVLAGRRPPRPRARDGASRPRRDPRRRSTRRSQPASRRSSSRTPTTRRRACRSTSSASSPRAARCSSAASRRSTPARSRWEADVRGDPRDRRREQRALDRSRPGREPAGRGRARADGRPAARGGLLRG